MPPLDPYTATILFGTELLKVINQAMLNFANSPAEYRQQFYDRLTKLEALADPLLNAISEGMQGTLKTK